MEIFDKLCALEAAASRLAHELNLLTLRISEVREDYVKEVKEESVDTGVPLGRSFDTADRNTWRNYQDKT